MLSEKILNLKKKILVEVAESFSRVEEISEKNTLKVLDAMRKLKVSDAHFKTSSGYAYGDIGREGQNLRLSSSNS